MSWNIEKSIRKRCPMCSQANIWRGNTFFKFWVTGENRIWKKLVMKISKPFFDKAKILHKTMQKSSKPEKSILISIFKKKLGSSNVHHIRVSQWYNCYRRQNWKNIVFRRFSTRKSKFFLLFTAFYWEWHQKTQPVQVPQWDPPGSWRARIFVASSLNDIWVVFERFMVCLLPSSWILNLFCEVSKCRKFLPKMR